jgi:ADP-glucose pyrophosphorylase
MGIYLFRFAVLREVLEADAQRPSTYDWGREILPGMLGRYRVAALPCVAGIGKAPTYWRDGGTIDTYWQAHMDLISPRVRVQLSLPHPITRYHPLQRTCSPTWGTPIHDMRIRGMKVRSW